MHINRHLWMFLSLSLAALVMASPSAWAQKKVWTIIHQWEQDESHASYIVRVRKKIGKRRFRSFEGSRIATTEPKIHIRVPGKGKYLVMVRPILQDGSRGMPLKSKLVRARKRPPPVSSDSGDLSSLANFREGDDGLPPTSWNLSLYGAVGQEAVTSRGLIGEYDGSGDLAGGGLRVEVLPKPSSNMVYLEFQAGQETYTTSVEQTVAETGATEIRSYNLARPQGSGAVMGRSNLTEEFWGFGLQLSSLAFTKFKTTDETTGAGELANVNLLALYAVFHFRTHILGGTFATTAGFSPIASDIRTLAAGYARLTQTYQFTDSFGMGLAFESRYSKATLQKDCAENVEDLCATPRAEQTAGLGLMEFTAFF